MRAYDFFSEVSSKKTGFPGIGVIVGIVSQYMIPYKTITWDRLYPDWREKPIYYVLFEHVRKPCTLEEVKSCNTHLSDYEAEEAFKNQKETNVISYVHDDLELVNEDSLYEPLTEKQKELEDGK